MPEASTNRKANKESKKEELWENTDGIIEDLVNEVTPVQLHPSTINEMVKDIREHMIDQFERLGVPREDVHGRAEEYYLEDDSDEDFPELEDIDDDQFYGSLDPYGFGNE